MTRAGPVGEGHTGLQVRYVQTGGLAGLRMVAEVDVDALSADQSLRLRNLVDAAVAAQPAPVVENPRLRDGFHHEIVVQRGAETVHIVVRDPAVPDAVGALIAELAPLAKPQRKS